jgi:hypothetical protein
MRRKQSCLFTGNRTHEGVVRFVRWLLLLCLVVPQAVQDMCVHKMAEKLYSRLQQVGASL